MLNGLYPPLPSEIRTRIVTLWTVLFVGALLIGGIALYLGTFIRGNVREQLEAQQIVFTPEAELTPVETAKDPCLTQYAGQTMTTGDQARCYSEHYIGLHMAESANRAALPGATYATLGKEQTTLRAAIAAAQVAGNQEAVRSVSERLTAITALRNTMQSGSTLRGQLLNAWGWDTFGMGIIATGAVLLVASLVFAGALLYELRTR